MPGRPDGPKMVPRLPQTGTKMTPGRPQEGPVAPAGSRRSVDMARGPIQDGPRCERGPGDQTRWPQSDPE
eukprot:9247331-Pyramimonas_sp.AAC.1